MEIVPVSTGKPYEIHMESGILSRCGEELLALRKPCKCCVITDTNVRPLYADMVGKSLQNAGFTPLLCTIKAGESSKTLTTFGEILSFLAQNSMTRSDVIVALGGGVVGDLAGFVAASYLRGIDYIQIPTTLLSQVDSSVGGKTAVDLPEGKNLAGAFYQPSLVLIDPDTLKTLSDKTFSDGMAEVIKYGCIWNRAFFNILAGRKSRSAVMEKIDLILKTCCSIKAEIVSEDEHDHGQRMLLNFGHTAGHGYELSGHYKTYTHGEAVAAGMVTAIKAGIALGVTKPETLPLLLPLLEGFQLPATIPCSREHLTAAVGVDKKGSGGEITLVLLTEIGRSFLKKLPKEEALELLCEALEEQP